MVGPVANAAGKLLPGHDGDGAIRHAVVGRQRSRRSKAPALRIISRRTRDARAGRAVSTKADSTWSRSTGLGDPREALTAGSAGSRRHGGQRRRRGDSTRATGSPRATSATVDEHLVRRRAAARCTRARVRTGSYRRVKKTQIDGKGIEEGTQVVTSVTDGAERPVRRRADGKCNDGNPFQPCVAAARRWPLARPLVSDVADRLQNRAGPTMSQTTNQSSRSRV